MGPQTAVAIPTAVVAVDLGFCFSRMLQYFRKSHRASLAVPLPNETQRLILVPWHDIQQQHPTLAAEEGEKSSLVEVAWVGKQVPPPLAGHHHPAIRDRVARHVVDALVDTSDI
jgi:hypothetical protein